MIIENLLIEFDLFSEMQKINKEVDRYLLNHVLISRVYELIRQEDVFVRDLVEVVAIESSVEIIVYQCILEHYSTRKQTREVFFSLKVSSTFFFVDR